ncbi:MAG: hypothetical protein ACI8VC_000883 [Candidatus Endobugula sp.]|jgi:hypothetical protein
MTISVRCYPILYPLSALITLLPTNIRRAQRIAGIINKCREQIAMAQQLTITMMGLPFIKSVNEFNK